jgi:ADP-ribose pyrophosphatase
MEVLARRQLAENVRFRVCFDEVSDERGNRVRDYLSVLPRAIAAEGVTGIAVLPVRGGRIGLMRMYRHPYGGCAWEVPMGFMEGSESPEDAALRELQEETGISADPGDLESLGHVSPAPSIVAARIRLFSVSVSGEGSPHPADEVGHGRYAWFAAGDALRLADAGEIVEPCTLVCLYRFLRGQRP